MAEYYMTYNEISDELDKFLAESENISNISKYKAEVLAAITGNYTPNDLDSVHQMVELWQNQIAQPSKLLLGDRYIRVQSMMLEFLAAACTSGLLDSIIASVSAGTLTGFSISVGSRACLKKAFCKMCVTICGIFCPDEGAVAGYGN